MSKSIGNTVNPLEAADKYGADALRFNLATGSTPGNDMKFCGVAPGRHAALRQQALERDALHRVRESRRHAARAGGRRACAWSCRRSRAARWPTAGSWPRQHDLAADVQRLMEDYQFGEAGRLIYEFIWGEFCDWYLECAKGPLNGGDAQAKADTIAVLRWTLERSLRLLHPFMPFVTEELWQFLLGQPAERTDLPPAEQSIMVRPWPRPEEAPADPAAERDFGLLMAIITAIRNARAEAIKDAPEGQKADLARRRIAAYLAAGAQAALLEAQRDILIRLAQLDPANVIIGAEMPEAASDRPDDDAGGGRCGDGPAHGGTGGPGRGAGAPGERGRAGPGRDRAHRGAAGERAVRKQGQAGRGGSQREKLAAARDRLAVLQTRLAAFE